MAEMYIEVDYVECDDGCGYIGDDFITDYNSEEGRQALKKKGFDVSNPSHLSSIQTMFSGYICPSCGKFDSMQVLPDIKSKNDLEGKITNN